MAYLQLNSAPQLLWGMSMGGSFAIHAAHHEPKRWKSLVIVSSFDSLEGVVRDSTFEPVSSLVAPLISFRGGFDLSEVRPVDLAKTLTLPALIIHGVADELIDDSRGRALFEAFAGRKSLILVPGGTHQNVLVTEAPVYAAMAEWLRTPEKSR